eukprot:1157194-Pelagomonas_calceolata.AAC.4
MLRAICCTLLLYSSATKLERWDYSKSLSSPAPHAPGCGPAVGWHQRQHRWAHASTCQASLPPPGSCTPARACVYSHFWWDIGSEACSIWPMEGFLCLEGGRGMGHRPKDKLWPGLDKPISMVGSGGFHGKGLQTSPAPAAEAAG